jgi:hypothetical protein
MNKLSLLTIAALLSFSSVADENTEYCKGISNLAGSIMELRQSGAPMSDLYELLSDSTGSLAIIKLAYQYPMYETRQYKVREVARFKNQLFMICINQVT